MMQGKYLFSFTRSIKSKAQLSSYNLSPYYEVYNIVGTTGEVLVKWENGIKKDKMIFTLEEVESNLDKGLWLKLK